MSAAAPGRARSACVAWLRAIFFAAEGDVTVQRHVLGLERRDIQAAFAQPAAEGGGEDALTDRAKRCPGS